MKTLNTPITGITKDSFSLKSLHIDAIEKSIMCVYSVGWNEYLEWQEAQYDASGNPILDENEMPLTSTASGLFYRPIDYHNTTFTNVYIVTDGTVICHDNMGNMPVANPYNTIISRVNTGNWSPESNIENFFEYILKSYAGL